MKRKWSTALVVVIALIGLVLLTRRFVSLEQLAAHEAQLRDLIATSPWAALVVGLSVYYIASLVPGSWGKAIVVGWLFGFWQGVLIVDVALTAAAITTFALSRYVLRDAVEGRMWVFLLRLNRAIAQDGAFYLLTLRLFHVPYSLVNWGAGASRVSAFAFAWTTMLGLLPGTVVAVLVGTRLPTLQQRQNLDSQEACNM